MAKSPKHDKPECDPRGGDAILKRMLQTKPKPHSEMVKSKPKPKGASAETKPTGLK